MGASSKQKGKKLWISPKAMEKGLHINLECIYNCYKVMDLAVILCILVKGYMGSTYGNVNIWLLF
jgi:hypothetical protein